MLKKLFLYDFTATGRRAFPLLIAILGAGAISLLVVLVGSFLPIDDTYGTVSNLLTAVLYLVILASLVLFFLATLQIYLHYFRSFFSNEGCFTFLIPASREQLFFSKVLSGFVWTLLIFFAVIVELFADDDLNGKYAVGICLCNSEIEMLKIKLIALDGDLAELLHYPAAERNAVRIGFDLEFIAKILKVYGAINDKCVLCDLLVFLNDLIVLIPNISDELFQNILHRNDSERSAVFVNNNGNVRFLLLKMLQKVDDLFGFVDKHGLRHNIL